MESDSNYAKSERLDRLEQHQRQLKEKMEDVAGDVRDIKNAIMGNPLSTEKGMSARIKDVEDEIEVINEFKSEVETYMKQAKYVIGIVLAALATLLVKTFSK
jgi:hypothetical protein